MGTTVTEKIITEHLVAGAFKSGEEIGITVDQTLTQDATGTMVYLQFESMDMPRVRTELSVSYVDHNTIQSDNRNMDDHLFLQDIAKKYGLYFSRPGNGICHHVHLERFGIPGKTLLGSDSHTPTGGGLGMIAIGSGGLDVAAAMAGNPFYLTCPDVIGVHLIGKLHSFCSAKDIILTILGLETVKGGVGKVYEYFGDGVASLSIPQRSTITNMGAELGATTSVFPSDEITQRFLAIHGREQAWREISADPDADYNRVIEIDLSRIEPMIARPHMPDNVVPVRALAGKPVEQVAIGSCTNSSINDLGIAADILDGRTVAEGVALSVSPGSREVFLSAEKAGIIRKLVKSGARILEFACGPCIGMGFAPAAKAVSVRTFNRNFKGRSGTPDAEVYLASPETAAAAALHGKITDPRHLTGIEYTDYTSFIETDDSMIIPPAPETEASRITVRRGPNIKPCPKNSPLPNDLRMRIILKTGDNITTDHIMPAGAGILPLRSNIPEISKHVFENIDPDFYNKAKEAVNGVIIGGENYGQGSSREHAALAPMYLGIKVVIAKSFARIHRSNLINFGIVPLQFENPHDYNMLEDQEVLRISHLREDLAADKSITVYNETRNTTINVRCPLGNRLADILVAGGLLNQIRRKDQSSGEPT